MTNAITPLLPLASGKTPLQVYSHPREKFSSLLFLPFFECFVVLRKKVEEFGKEVDCQIWLCLEKISPYYVLV